MFEIYFSRFRRKGAIKCEEIRYTRSKVEDPNRQIQIQRLKTSQSRSYVYGARTHCLKLKLSSREQNILEKGFSSHYPIR